MDEYVGSIVIINFQVCPVGHLFRNKPSEDRRILKQKIESQLYSYSTAGDGMHMEFGRLKNRRTTTSLLYKVSEISY